MLIFDIETNGLLVDMTKIHCLNMYDRTRDVMLRFNGDSIPQGVKLLQDATCIGGHNVHEFDVPAIQKIYPEFEPTGKVVDSRAWSRLIWPTLDEKDFAALRAHKLPLEFQKAGLIGMHSLEAWGWRMGERKGSFDPATTGHTWATVPFSKEMDDYCCQDILTTVALFKLIESKEYDPRALEIENEVARIIAQQQRNGFGFDKAAASALYAKLQIRRVTLEQSLAIEFPPWQVVDKNNWIPKVNNKARGYVKGVPVTTYKTITFNPGSRDHIADRLTNVLGWEPSEFTEGGKPKVDETVLDAMSAPVAKLLNEYLMIDKRLGQIGDGKQAWLKSEVDGRIYGKVNSNGAVTGRMTHHHPNVAQTPRIGSPYGEECRACWIAPKGWVLVGCDAEGLELRMLAHYLARYDGGTYGASVVDGKKSDGTDVHSVNMRAIEFNSREHAKTWVYAFLYGAGDFKLGTIVVEDFTTEKLGRFNVKFPSGRDRDGMIKKLGTQSRERIKARIPALGELIAAVEHAVKARGFVKSLDGRILPIRHKHAALNTLLQGAGAVVMKQALLLLDRKLLSIPLHSRNDFMYVANIHDEFQIQTKEQHAATIGQLAAESIRSAGELLEVRCPLSGSFSVGANWAETH